MPRKSNCDPNSQYPSPGLYGPVPALTVQGPNPFVCVCINMYNYIYNMHVKHVVCACRQHIVPKEIDHLFSDLHTGLIIAEIKPLV